MTDGAEATSLAGSSPDIVAANVTKERRSHLTPMLLATFLVGASISPAVGQTAPPAQTCELGDLTLESGAKIPNFRMTYITFGTLNAQKNNAVLSLHGLQGNRNGQSFLAGPNRAFDTNRYFVVQPDTLGVATVEPNATTSPTRSGMNMAFPRFSVRDMVQSEHRMLTECLGIQRLVAVSGVSMGGIESLQWAVSYPDFMDAIIPIVPTARTHRQGNYAWEGVRQTVLLDPKWRDGNYPNDDPPRQGLAVGLQIQSILGSSAPGYEASFTSRDEVLAAYATDVNVLAYRLQPRDWIYRSWAIQGHDISRGEPFNGDLAAAARSIRARVLLLPNCYDQLHPPREGGVLEIAQHIPTAKLVDLDDIGGHRGFQSPRAVGVITAEIQDLLKRIADERPGISGPRFPRAWPRSDYCPH
jgi:homoserine O-acetyltransferase/O-succinyltransferase